MGCLHDPTLAIKLKRVLVHKGSLVEDNHSQARSLINNGAVADLETLSLQARDFITKAFTDVEDVLKPLSWVKWSHCRQNRDPNMAFYYEHGYNYVFPILEPLLQKDLVDPHAVRTPGGRERRDSVYIGKRYIQDKIALEKQHKTHLMNQSARLNRRTAQVVSLLESSLLGMAAEATARGFDPGAVISDMVFSSPATDVVDVGSDLVNSEVMNSFLNVTDVTDTGIVSEDVLCRAYDAYAVNDRHMFVRRALLGWPKARKIPTRPQCEADFDEVFDEQYRTTGFYRPLDSRYACNGEDLCDHARHFLDSNQEEPLFRDLWWSLVMDPLEYVRGGQVDEQREHHLVEVSRLQMAELYSNGLVLGISWLLSHESHHAW
ncbi:hypothetical protein PT974_07645 [Cladobotryum mycophilum]|uniref:Uncharacterized protein n=1 Tax=Cladobotryum mycophilum TaxID=491253 RepID=A0ABR0SQL7_9HYPO